MATNSEDAAVKPAVAVGAEVAAGADVETGTLGDWLGCPPPELQPATTPHATRAIVQLARTPAGMRLTIALSLPVVGVLPEWQVAGCQDRGKLPAPASPCALLRGIDVARCWPEPRWTRATQLGQ